MKYIHLRKSLKKMMLEYQINNDTEKHTAKGHTKNLSFANSKYTLKCLWNSKPASK